jgi:hypothetical protein
LVKFLPSNRAFLDTTILADAVLKPGGEGIAARTALARFSERLLPQYAIKEFKAGVLRNYIWLHTKAVTQNNYADVMHALTKMWAKPRLSSTALRAIADFESSISSRMPKDYGTRFPDESEGKIRKSEMETWLRTLIFRAWRKRLKIATQVRPLECYPLTEIKLLSNGLIDEVSTTCGVDDCCLRSQFEKRGHDIGNMLAVFDELPRKPETGKRKVALDHIYRTPRRPLSERQCRDLGDAVFVLQCPANATLLTTNVADHLPLGRAIGVSVSTKPSLHWEAPPQSIRRPGRSE